MHKNEHLRACIIKVYISGYMFLKIQVLEFPSPLTHHSKGSPHVRVTKYYDFRYVVFCWVDKWTILSGGVADNKKTLRSVGFFIMCRLNL
jgi:hypothetical protein